MKIVYFLFWMVFSTTESAKLNIGSNRIEINHFGSVQISHTQRENFLNFGNLAQITENYVLFLQNRGMYYYEAIVTDEGLCRLGFSTSEASLDLGTCKFGYGYGGTGKVGLF